MTYIVISKEEKTMATALLTQKYTNDVQNQVPVQVPQSVASALVCLSR